MTSTTTDGVEPRGLGSIWAAGLLGPVAWLADLEVSLMYTRTAVATDRKWPLFAFHGVALALTVVALLMLNRQRRRLAERGDAALAAARSLVAWGIAFAVFAALLIVGMVIPTVVFHPRDLP